MSNLTVQLAANFFRARGFYVWQDMQSNYSLHIQAERNSGVVLASVKTVRGLSVDREDMLAALKTAEEAR